MGCCSVLRTKVLVLYPYNRLLQTYTGVTRVSFFFLQKDQNPFLPPPPPPTSSRSAPRRTSEALLLLLFPPRAPAALSSSASTATGMYSSLFAVAFQPSSYYSLIMVSYSTSASTTPSSATSSSGVTFKVFRL